MCLPSPRSSTILLLLINAYFSVSNAPGLIFLVKVDSKTMKALLVILAVFMSVGLSHATPRNTSELDSTRGLKIEHTERVSGAGTINNLLEAGDFNGDGLDDLVISQKNQKTVSVIFGSTTGTPASIHLSDLNGTNGVTFIIPATSGDLAYGVNATGVGDVNNDGIDDLAIAGFKNDNPYIDPKVECLYVVYGRRGSYAATIQIDQLGPSELTTFKGCHDRSISGGIHGAGKITKTGDINGDGISDFMFHTREEVTEPNRPKTYGAWRVVYGVDGGFGQLVDLNALTRMQSVKILPGFDNTFFSSASSRVGDFNADGVDDIALSAGSHIYVVYGRATRFATPVFRLSDLTPETGLIIRDRSYAGLLGRNVFIRGGGDFNGDGIDDIATSGYQWTNVIFGRAGGYPGPVDIESLDATTGYTMTGYTIGGEAPLAMIGDINGDGRDDFATGDAGEAGSVYVFYGRNDNNAPSRNINGLNGRNGFQLDAATEFHDLGGYVSGAGDFNGDGLYDFVTGYRKAESDNLLTSYVVFGTNEIESKRPDYCGDSVIFPGYSNIKAIWQDCPYGVPSGRWHIRQANGCDENSNGPPSCPTRPTPYKWSVQTDGFIADIDPFDTEQGDSIARPGPFTLTFEGEVFFEGDISNGVRDPVDGFDFDVDGASYICVGREQSIFDSTISVGPGQIKKAAPVDLISGLPCDIVPEVPTLSVTTKNATESNTTLLLEVALEPASQTQATVKVATQGQSAQPGRDFYGTSQMLTFAPGETKKIVPIEILNDTVPENDERFYVRLYNPEGALIADSKFVITIKDDDEFPNRLTCGEPQFDGDTNPAIPGMYIWQECNPRPTGYWNFKMLGAGSTQVIRREGIIRSRSGFDATGFGLEASDQLNVINRQTVSYLLRTIGNGSDSFIISNSPDALCLVRSGLPVSPVYLGASRTARSDAEINLRDPSKRCASPTP